jgi:hypothetical protein
VLLGLYVVRSAWVAFFLYHAGIVALSFRDEAWKRLFRGWRAGPALGAAAFGLSGGVLLFLLAPAAGVDAARLGPPLARLGLTGGAWLGFVLYHALVNPWLEEAYWRGALGSADRRPALGDALFAGYHVPVLVLFLDRPWVVPSFLLLFTAAWVWRRMASSSGGLLLPALSHVAADTGIMAVAYLRSQGP